MGAWKAGGSRGKMSVDDAVCAMDEENYQRVKKLTSFHCRNDAPLSGEAKPFAYPATKHAVKRVSYDEHCAFPPTTDL
jgi:hypothetical protein